MNKSLKTVIIAVAIVILGVVAYWGFAAKFSNIYYAVSTANGQFFVGKLSYVPFTGFIKLENPFILQNVQSEDQKTVVPQLLDLSVESYWLPKSIYINLDQIVFKGKVGKSSPIALKLKEYNDAKTNPPAAPTPAPATPPATPAQ